MTSAGAADVGDGVDDAWLVGGGFAWLEMEDERVPTCVDGLLDAVAGRDWVIARATGAPHACVERCHW